jgi:hypothetical protein
MVSGVFPKNVAGRYPVFDGENIMKKFFQKILPAAGVLALSAPAFAGDLDALTNGIDFSEVTTAVVAVAGALMAVYVVWKGASMILRAIRGL